MIIFWVFTVCGGFTRSMVIFQKLFSQCMQYNQWLFSHNPQIWKKKNDDRSRLSLCHCHVLCVSAIGCFCRRNSGRGLQWRSNRSSVCIIYMFVALGEFARAASVSLSIRRARIVRAADTRFLNWERGARSSWILTKTERDIERERALCEIAEEEGKFCNGEVDTGLNGFLACKMLFNKLACSFSTII